MSTTRASGIGQARVAGEREMISLVEQARRGTTTYSNVAFGQVDVLASEQNEKPVLVKLFSPLNYLPWRIHGGCGPNILGVGLS